MSKTVLTISAMLGIVVFYFLALVIATKIIEVVSAKDNFDDYDYAMTANVIQFFVMVIIIAEKVGKWIN